eukprot:14094_5
MASLTSCPWTQSTSSSMRSLTRTQVLLLVLRTGAGTCPRSVQQTSNSTIAMRESSTKSSSTTMASIATSYPATRPHLCLQQSIRRCHRLV